MLGLGRLGLSFWRWGSSSSSATDLPNGFYSLILLSGFAYFSNKGRIRWFLMALSALKVYESGLQGLVKRGRGGVNRRQGGVSFYH